MNTQTQTQTEIERIKEVINYELRQKVLDEIYDTLNVVTPHINEIAEKTATKLKEYIENSIADERLKETLCETFDNLPKDILYFIAAGVERAVRKTFEVMLFDIDDKTKVASHTMKVPETLESLPDEIKKPLSEWWEWYNERFALPVVAFPHYGGLRVCVTYNAARVTVLCVESCMGRGKDETSCREECRDHLGADHIASSVRKHLQRILDVYGIKHNAVDLWLGNTKYTCVDIAFEKQQTS